MGVLVGELRFLRPVGPKSRPLRAHLLSGFLGRCPKCAKGRIFEKGLSIRSQCPVCELNLSGHESGDGPAVAATFFLGALALAIALWIEFVYRPPLWVHAAAAVPVVVIGAFLMLRPLKGMLIAMQYRYRDIEKEDDNLSQM